MLNASTRWMFALGLFLFASSTFAQFGENILDRPEFRHFWNPVVGNGAAYETTSADAPGKKRALEFLLVSQEMVDGKTGYWLEMKMEASAMNGTAYGKSLVVPGEMRPRRTIIQYPGLDPMELPLRPNAAPPKHEIDPKKVPHQIGTETITVPAGTFVCEHWKDDSGEEAWTNSKVGPISVVKTVRSGQTMVLVKTITNGTDHISGTVKPFDPRALAQFVQQQKAAQQ